MRLKDISILTPQYTGKPLDTEVSFVPMESLRNGNIDLKEIPYKDAKGKYTFFGNGDLLIAKVTPCFENGNIAIAENLKEGIGFGSSEIFVLRFNKNALNTYMFYVSQSAKFQDAACATMCGVGGLKRISPLFMKTYEFDIPTISEQQRIVDYLDRKTKAIDARISVLEKKSDAYTRLKASVINRAVTRGLNPNVPLKDSGIEWIGMIPELWEIKRIKDNFKCYGGSTPSSKVESYWDGSIIWIAPADMQAFGEISEGANTITQEGYNSCGTTLVPEGSIIISTRAPIGKVNITTVPMCTSQGCKSIVPYNINNNYAAYYLFCKSKELNVLGRGTTFIELSYKSLVSFPIPFPPITEQQEIVSYLDSKCSEIDNTIDNIGKQIDALKRLKRSLINEVVTGKRKV